LQHLCGSLDNAISIVTRQLGVHNWGDHIWFLGDWERNKYWDYGLLEHDIMYCGRTVPTFMRKILEIGAVGSSKLLVPIYQTCKHHTSWECILSQWSPQHSSHLLLLLSFSNLSWYTTDCYKKWLNMKEDVP